MWLGAMAAMLAIVATPAPAADANEGYFAAQPNGDLMQVPRADAGAALLPDGQVLIVGGDNEESSALRSAELFDPDNDSFTLLAPYAGPLQARSGPVVATLPDGEVLVAGGERESSFLRSAELFNPATDQFVSLPEVGSSEMQTARSEAAVAPLPDGEVLIAGGYAGVRDVLDSAELFDPSNDTFTELPDTGDHGMIEGRYGAVAAPLPDGKVLISGGGTFGSGDPAETDELFNPARGSFEGLVSPSPVEPQHPRESAAAASLPGGQILIVGGQGGVFYVARTAELFDPVNPGFSLIGGSQFEAATVVGRLGSFGVLLPNGQVLIGGGYGYTVHEQATSNGSELFYSAPQATVTGGSFDDQSVGASSPLSVITLTNVGAQELDITGATLQGIDQRDFAVVADACVGRRLAFEQTCQITAAFTPSATGPRAATVALADNEQTPTEIALTGTGVSPVSDSSASSQAADTRATTGASAAADGAARQTARGTRIVVCHILIRHRLPLQRCTTKYTATPVADIPTGSVAAVLWRHGHLYASGWVLRAAGEPRLLLTRRRRVRPGVYTLVLTGAGKHVRDTVAIG
jgi:hypothetical protein